MYLFYNFLNTVQQLKFGFRSSTLSNLKTSDEGDVKKNETVIVFFLFCFFTVWQLKKRNLKHSYVKINRVRELKSAASFSGSYWKTDHLYQNQFTVIQHLPLISFLANLAGDGSSLV